MPELKNEQWERFAQEYSKSSNITEAAHLAGYSPKTCNRQGWVLLKKPEIAARVKELNEEKIGKIQVSIENVVTELMILSFSDVRNICDWSDQHLTLRDSKDLSPSVTKAIKEINYYFDGETNSGRVSIKMHDKVAALEKLGKHIGMFLKEKPEGDKINPGDKTELAERLLNQLTQTVRDNPCQDLNPSLQSSPAPSSLGLLGESNPRK